MKVESYQRVDKGGRNITWMAVLMVLAVYGITEACWNPPPPPPCQCSAALCLTCVDGDCLECSGDENKYCCYGTCCGATEHCCSDGHCCPADKRCCGSGCRNLNQVCCNGTPCEPGELCCDGKTCYDPDTEQCCGNGDGKTCSITDCEDCNSTTGGCDSRCKPELCEECDGAGHCVSTCAPNESCCDGTCYDPATKQCCGSGDGKTCDVNQTCCDDTCCEPEHACCNGTCCEPGQCCINGECVEPMCDNCHMVSMMVYECGHTQSDILCQGWYCIRNSIVSASCDYKGDDWPCRKSKCNTSPDGNLKSRQAIVLASFCPEVGQPVVYTEAIRLYFGCSDCTGEPYTAACWTGDCRGDLLGIEESYQKYKCGCP